MSTKTAKKSALDFSGKITPEELLRVAERCKTPESLPSWVRKLPHLTMQMALPSRGSPPFQYAAFLGYLIAIFVCRTPAARDAMKHGEWSPLPEPVEEFLIRGGIETIQVWASGELEVALDYMSGLTHGFKCVVEILKTGKPVKATNAWPIYDTLFIYQERIEKLVESRAKAERIAFFVAEHFPEPDRSRYADSFAKDKKAWPAFVERIKKACQRLGIPLSSRGRPRK